MAGSSDRPPAWDLFISHASEDKDSFVRPLATELSRLGLRVWYDEFSLQIGDSISESIDRGLAESRCGLVILSDSFIAKPWPRRELAGLVAGQIGKDQLIISVWHKVSMDDVLSFSPPLADRKAIIATQISPPDVALRILERVRPDLHQAYQRKLAFQKLLEESEGEISWVDPKELKHGPIRHETLSQGTVYILRVIREALLEVLPLSWQTTVDNFRRDIDPSSELAHWVDIAGIYLTVTNEFELDYAERRNLLGKIILDISAGPQWDMSDVRPDWEQRAFELCSFKGDPSSDSFASRTRGHDQ